MMRPASTATGVARMTHRPRRQGREGCSVVAFMDRPAVVSGVEHALVLTQRCLVGEVQA